MDLIEFLQTHALPISALTGALGVLAASFSAWTAWISFCHAREVQQAAQESERLRLVSQVSDVRSQLFSELRRARLIAVELQRAYLLEASARNMLNSSRYELRKDALDRQIKVLEEKVATTEPLVVLDENDEELESSPRAALEKLLRLNRKALHLAMGQADDLEREFRKLDDRLHPEPAVAN